MVSREFGSDFHAINEYPAFDDAQYLSHLISMPYQLHFSGRTALYAIIKNGIEVHGWKKIFFPEYFCHEVINYIKNLPVSVLQYKDGPYYNEVENGQFDCLDESENAFIVVNYFGIQKEKKLPLSKAYFIEDHTHDVISDWSLSSTAHYCIASLRKSMPIPTGGIAWSPMNLSLPFMEEGKKNYITATFFMKLSAMLLKADYLKGEGVLKADFRNLYLESEARFSDLATQGNLPEYGKNLIESIPLNSLKIVKAKNIDLLSLLIKNKFHIHSEIKSPNSCPLGLILMLDSKVSRDKLRQYLTEKLVYTAILWPNQKTIDSQFFSDRMILIHCDLRYNEKDIKCIGQILNEYETNEH